MGSGGALQVIPQVILHTSKPSVAESGIVKPGPSCLSVRLSVTFKYRCHICDGLRKAGTKCNRVNYCSSKSFKVIDFGTNRKCVLGDGVSISGQYSNPATWTLYCTVSEIRRLKCRKSTIFPTALLFQLKFWYVPWCRSVMLESALHYLHCRKEKLG